MSEEINHDRRRLIGAAVLTLAAAELATIASADAQSGKVRPIKPATNTSFGSLKQIDAGVLNVGYAEAGPANGPPVILLHGLALRHLQLCRCRAVAGVGGLSRVRPVSARLWLDALSFQ
jgi:hypothetical protein